MLRPRSISVAMAIVVLALVACRIEDRTPAGSRRDDETIRSILATYYRSVGERDWAGSRELFLDSAMVEVRIAGDSGWRDFTTADAYHHHLARTYAAAEPSAIALRIFRLDLRQEGDLAAAWVTTRRRPVRGEGRSELGSTDYFILRRSGGAWRIVALASTPDPAVRAR